MTSSPPTVSTRILFLSDTHGALPPLPASDLVIHTGDLTNNGRQTQLLSQMRHLASSPAALKLVIAGNHDITLDRAYYARMGSAHHYGYRESSGLEDLDACRAVWDSAEARSGNVVYLDEGITTHKLPNGAEFTVYASPYQPEFYDWAFPYQRNEDRFNATPTIPGGQVVEGAVAVPDWPEVDIMMTHGPPFGTLDTTRGGNSAGCENLRRAVRRCKPKIHAFGHIHEGWGAESMRWGKDGEESVENLDVEEGDGFVYFDLRGREGWGKETVFVNSSVMDVRYRPVQQPILVDMELPLSKGSNSD